MEYSWSTNCQRSRYCRNRDASAAESPTGATSNLCARKKRGAAALGACVARVRRNERGGLRPRGAGRALCGAPCRPRGVGARPARSRSPWWRALAANLVPATTATDSCSVLSSRSLGSASSTEGHNSAAPRRGLTCRVEGGGVRVWRAGGWCRVGSSHQSLCRWCGLVPISEDLELVLELHGRIEKGTVGKRIRESVTKLG